MGGTQIALCADIIPRLFIRTCKQPPCFTAVNGVGIKRGSTIELPGQVKCSRSRICCIAIDSLTCAGIATALALRDERLCAVECSRQLLTAIISDSQSGAEHEEQSHCLQKPSLPSPVIS